MDNLFTSYLALRWQDLLDIAINSYILFRLYVLFRGTNAFRVLIGIGLLWFFQRVAVSMGLIVTSWVMQGITAAAALIIIIVFRNEIRSVLQIKRLKTILWGLPRPNLHTPVDKVVEGVYALSRSRIGALLVLPGKEDIREVCQGGLDWRGLISSEMIRSVFRPESPVHDGAAVIQGRRIAEVGVILPLSYRQDLPSHYGTRHRAAMGLVEKTDALVIIVSEESGHVLVAKGATITEVTDNVKLLRLLRQHAGLTADEKYVRREHFKLGLAALLSVMFVMGIWASFSRGLESLIALDVPVEYMNRDFGMEILDTSVNSVKLNLSGSGALIKSIRPEQIRIRLDIAKAVVGRNIFTITADNITLPPGVVLKRVQPSVVEVLLDVPVTKKMPVQIDWVGKLPENLQLVSAKVAPAAVALVGASRVLDVISTIYTEKVLLDNISSSGRLTVNLALNPASLKIAPGAADKIIIDYVIAPRASLVNKLEN